MKEIVHEGMATVLSLVILLVASFFLVDTYLAGRVALEAPQVAAYGRQKDLLQVAIALLGTVTGYYLGRVPAEKRAVRAEQRETEANAVASQEIERGLELKRTTHSQLLALKRSVDAPIAERGMQGSSELLDQILKDLEKP